MAMTPAPPVPAAVHNAKVTSGVEGCSENHQGGPAAGIGRWITAMLGPAASTAIMMATEMTIRMAAVQARTRLSRSRAGRDRPAVAGALGGPSAGRGGSPGVSWAGPSGSGRSLVLVADAGRGELTPETPGYAERDGSLPLATLLAIPARRRSRSPMTPSVPGLRHGPSPRAQALPATGARPPKFTGRGREGSAWPVKTIRGPGRE